MEKIKLENGTHVVKDVVMKCVDKMNEIIDWLEKIAENQVDYETESKDRLKTLEDKVNKLNKKFIAFKTIQDLWDEGNDKLIAEKLDNGFEGKHTSEPIVKEYSLWGRKKDAIDYTKPTDNSEKIEEIISDFCREFPSDMFRYPDYKYTLSSWLRDKLKDICK